MPPPLGHCPLIESTCPLSATGAKTSAACSSNSFARSYRDRRRSAPRSRSTLAPADLVARLALHSWPGNVRQLRNVLRQLVISNRGRSEAQLGATLPEALREPATTQPPSHAEPSDAHTRFHAAQNARGHRRPPSGEGALRRGRGGDGGGVLGLGAGPSAAAAAAHQLAGRHLGPGRRGKAGELSGRRRTSMDVN